MSRDTALLTFSIGPVHAFIAQARRLADLWAGSYLLSHLIRQAVSELRKHGGEMVFPYLPEKDIPDGIPNRFVCRVEAVAADEVAGAMARAVQDVLTTYARGAALRLRGYFPFETIWSEEEGGRQTDHLLDIAWSWVPEEKGYAEAALAGARRFEAVRRFRPFRQSGQPGEKCAICGERTALPDGDRRHVRDAWERAARDSEKTDLERFLRLDQTRLCLVCATKRLLPVAERRESDFVALDRFQPHDDAPYLALVKMDGDRMGRMLGLGPEAVRDGDLEAFHREVSRVLTGLAQGLRRTNSPDLNLAALGGYEPQGQPPQLLYAGGDDVLFVCDPRDALPLVDLLRAHYLERFEPVRLRLAGGDPFTVSAAVLFAHPAHPAGLLLHDVEELLDEVAKERMDRNAVAIRLAKRGGPPVEVAFRWDDPDQPGWTAALAALIGNVKEGVLTSGQTFNLRLEETTLQDTFDSRPELWKPWLAERLSRNDASGDVKELAGRIAPFFIHRRSEALRIARFLGREVQVRS
ncbi:MAG TPA: type III-B CRISPR-associated protein Cas10/Cmr2 [Thermoanaerobaculia bacterium]|jgi:CRISPR-associated protein Cmr2|nr:type III-B CRISPR-associated protein Cas10/Cmr2 [Thermoanaerobaculia bacterium]